MASISIDAPGSLKALHCAPAGRGQGCTGLHGLHSFPDAQDANARCRVVRRSRGRLSPSRGGWRIGSRPRRPTRRTGESHGQSLGRQPRIQFLARHRPCEQVALEVVAAESDQQVALVDGFDTFGQRTHAHDMRDLDDLAEQLLGAFLPRGNA